MLRPLAIAALALPLTLAPDAVPTQDAAPTERHFAQPVRVEADGAPVRTQWRGYAAPAIHDVDGDGIDDLVVGQFNDGRLALHRGQPDGTYAARAWLQADGEDAVVPGVW